MRETADRANSREGANEAYLNRALENVRPSIRYWAVVGLAELDSADARNAVHGAMADASAVVRIAAAGMVLRRDASDGQALDVLREELQSPHEWVRLHAATALDEAGEAARPALHELQAALEDGENKYVVRVANHAVNVLLGTINDVR